MAQLYKNNKDFLVIEMSHTEATNICDFGFRDSRFHSIVICDTCCDVIKNPVYYVAILNRVLCEDCLNDFIKNYDKPKEDKEYEAKHYNYYAKVLNL